MAVTTPHVHSSKPGTGRFRAERDLVDGFGLCRIARIGDTINAAAGG